MLDKYNSNQDSSVNAAASTGAMMAGGAVGAKVGAAVGSAICPGVGTLAGILAGALVGAATSILVNQIENVTDNIKNNSFLNDENLLSEAKSGAISGGSSVLIGGMTQKVTSLVGSKMGLETARIAGKEVSVVLAEDGTAEISSTVIKNAVANGLGSGIASGMVADGEYILETATNKDKEFSIADLATTTATSFAFGSLIGGITGGIEGYKGATEYNSYRLEIQQEAQARLLQEQLAEQKAQEAQAEYNKPFEENLSNKSAEESMDVFKEAEMQERILDIPEGKTEPQLDEQTVRALSEDADDLAEKFASCEDEATAQIKDMYEDLPSVEKVTGRAKGENSVYEKLAKKTIDGDLATTDIDVCETKIGDALGTRIQMKKLEQVDVEQVLNDSGLECSYQDLCKFMQGDMTDLSEETIASLTANETTIINALKERQNSEVFEKLLEQIEKEGNGFQITELNNYGDEITSYFTEDQVKRIAAAYKRATGEPLTIVTKENGIYGADKIYTEGEIGYTTQDYNISNKGAVKDSGYTSAQMNTKQTLSDGTTVNGEMQIRGTEVNKFGDVEHIPYDIRQGKIKATDTRYSEVYNTIKSLDYASYQKYNEYLTSVYKHLRLSELGIETNMPEIGSGYTSSIIDEVTKKAIPQGDIDVTGISFEGLLKYLH